MAGRRDFRAELAGDGCWDRGTQVLFERHGEPLEDCILQNREELIGLCEFIEAQGIRSYLEVERARFGERLEYAIEVDPSALRLRVPTMVLQTLVENAVKHGVARRTGGGRSRTSTASSGTAR